MNEDSGTDAFETGRGERSRAWSLRLLTLAGLLASVYYFSWWGEGGRILSPLLALGLMLAAVYHWSQLFSSWLIYLAARRRKPVAPPLGKGPTVDVFLTASGEDPRLVERALRAVVEMRGAHNSWLLDDGADPCLARLARRLGAGYLTRGGSHDAKAGNINAALPRTDAEIIAIFDVDHVPEPEFLERSLGYFRDPKIGFVQVMLSFRNERKSWFARAAAESCFDFFNPTGMGMDRLGSATLIGSNALIRREALESIGGYRAGLAEDLATSIALHAAGWKSAYVAEPLAPGLAPADVSAWFTQQLKWARGVFEILLVDYPRYFRRLRWGQRVSYAVRMTYYWAGLVSALHMIFTAGILIGGERVAVVDLQQYLWHLLPLIAVALVIRIVALRLWRHASVPSALQWRAVLLVHATWPVYTLAWFMAVLRLPLRFRATPKRLSLERRWQWLAPQIAASMVLLSAVVVGMSYPDTAYPGLLMASMGLQLMPQLILIWQATRTRPT